MAPRHDPPWRRRADAWRDRVDHLLVAEMVAPGAQVLDVGCGDGELLQLLTSRGVDGRGIELSREGVNRCVAKGLAVIQGDADTDLVDYPDDAFDYVILSQTLQATRQPRDVLEQMLRIGRRAIVSFPNFGHWKMRLQLLFSGRMPRTENLPETWYDTPNIHFCTIKDFVQLCDEVDVGWSGPSRSMPGASRCAERAVVGLEYVRRTGRVSAQPGREGGSSAFRRCSIPHIAWIGQSCAVDQCQMDFETGDRRAELVRARMSPSGETIQLPPASFRRGGSP